MGNTELLVKITGYDREAVAGLAAYLKANFEHCFPGPVRPNDKDSGWHVFCNISLEGSESAKIRRSRN